MRRKKGFTLTEIVIVVAIFTVLIAIITPAWAGYARRVKYRAQNKKAKAIFNAAQVVLTDLEFSERKYWAVLNDPSTDTLVMQNKAKMKNFIYTPLSDPDNDGWYYYWDGDTGAMCSETGTIYEENDDGRKPIIAEWNQRIGDEIKRIVTDDMAYKIWVKDYKVQAVVCASDENSRFMGSHPTSLLGLDDDVFDDLKDEHVDSIVMEHFDLS